MVTSNSYCSISSGFKCDCPDPVVTSANAIEVKWNGDDVVRRIDGEALKSAGQSRFQRNTTRYVLSPLVIIALCVGGWLVIRRYRRAGQNVAALLLATLVVADVKADEESSGPYCGLYCLHAAAAANGVSGDFGTILVPEFVTGAYGSTADDLVRAARTYGLNGRVIGDATQNRLRASRSPMILHTRVPGMAEYTHWILFLGFTDEGTIRIFDPPNAHVKLSVAELLSIWDGTAVVVEEPGISNWSPGLPYEWVGVTVLATCLLVVAKRIRFSWVTLPAAGAVLAAICHTFLPSGFVRNSLAVENVQSAFTARGEIAEIDYNRLVELMREPNTLLVDARMTSAYRMSHIAGATSVPVNCGYASLRDKMASIPKGCRVIVYCLSESCHWADLVAHQFLSRGYENVLIYRGGVRDWEAHASGE
jgi:rhodanese-related sulfurtransferase